MDVNDFNNVTEIRDDEDSNDCISILIATDNHLGYLENDPIRGQDSLNTFREILQIAKQNNVDMILLGGDLFHENRPSRKVLYETMKILRTYCMGDKQCQLEIINDDAENKDNDDNFIKVNFQDPNYKIAMPVFSIHGNHDDPSGDGNLCALDVLAVSGLVNYFGKTSAVDNIVVKPILLRKGRTVLALYGLGNVRDQRLHRMFTENAVKIYQPPTQISNESFNLMVLHQNRVAHSVKNYIPEHYLPDFMNIIIWGHEHDCKIEPVYNEQQNFFISQPGSSVATSLVEGELEPKHVAKLNIIGDQFELQKIRLRTVRPFVMGEIVLKEVERLDPTKTSAVSSLLIKKVEELIQDAKNQWLEMNDYDDELDDDMFPLPLIRLKVEYSGGFTVLNNRQFGQKFVNLVANNHEILHFHRKRVFTERKKDSAQSMHLPDEFEMPENLSHNYVTDLVTENMKTLSILPENALNEATTLFVDKDDPHAIEGFYNNTIAKTRTKLRQDKNLICDDKILIEEAHKQKTLLSRQYAEMNPDQRLIEMSNNEAPADQHEDVIDSDSQTGTSSRARSTSRGRATKSTRGTGTRARGRGRGKTSVSNKKNTEDEGFLDDLDPDHRPGTSTRTRGATATRSSNRTTTRSSLRNQVEIDSFDEDNDSDNARERTVSKRTSARKKNDQDDADYIEDDESLNDDNGTKKRKAPRNKNVEEPPAKRTYTSKKPTSSSSQRRVNFPTLASSSSQQLKSQSQTMEVDDDDFFE
ncbi:DNA repair exonuclease [Gigaspora margarita]|uniref:Double-strand break repair protein n=2 Tax=Gigaspora margarita TaxID=4874 RepID=A0A8H3X365_GIGMA|nr:DNA repair exonuclease [Gigaspora margarita]